MNDLEKQLQEAAANHDGEKIRRLVGMAAGQDGGESTRRRLAAILEKRGLTLLPCNSFSAISTPC